MSKATIEDAQNLLDGALIDVSDSETKFKIRTAQQFLEDLKQPENDLLEIVEEECDSKYKDEDSLSASDHPNLTNFAESLT
jgi:hypothetical protein